MSKIKIKIWDKKKNVMIHSGDIHYQDWNMSEFIDIILAGHDDSKIVLLSTGLKDKNGVEIYEGDIVEGCDEYHRKVVEYGIQEVDAFEGMGWNLWSFMAAGDADGKRLSSEHEVIGNIYQNKDLLK